MGVNDAMDLRHREAGRLGDHVSWAVAGKGGTSDQRRLRRAIREYDRRVLLGLQVAYGAQVSVRDSRSGGRGVRAQMEALPNWEAIVCGVGRKVERMRREEEIARLNDVSVAIEKVVKDKRRLLEEDPLFVHPAEVKDRIAELEPVERSLRPAPVVLHLDGLRVKIPYQEWKDQIAAVEVYGHRLGDIATISDSRLGGSTLIRIKTRSEVEDHDRRAKKG